MDDYGSLDATALAEKVASAEVTPLELVEAALAAVDAVNGQLNAVVHRMDAQARAAASSASLPEGPLRGVPIVVKDLDGFLAGEPYTMGSRFLKDFVPDRDAQVLAHLKGAGAIIVGKTNCPELGILGVTEPELNGPTRNPWNPDHAPNGSSGGTGACVAARVVPMGHGGDGGGSIRLPSSACGLFGMKATRGRISLGPDVGEGWGGYVQPGVLTRSVRDSALALDVMAGPGVGDPYWAPPQERPYREEIERAPEKLRIAYSTAAIYGESTHPDCVAAIEDVAKLCAELGHTVVPAAPELPKRDLVWAYLIQVSAGVGADFRDFERWTGRAATPEGFEATTWFLKQVGDALTATDLQWSRDLCHATGRQMARFHEDHDIFLSATAAHPPVRIGELAPKPWERLGMALARRVPIEAALIKALRDLSATMLERTANTQLFNQTGQPAMSVPLATTRSGGLPIGLQFSGRFGDEATLFRLARQLEEARPWSEARPPICA